MSSRDETPRSFENPRRGRLYALGLLILCLWSVWAFLLTRYPVIAGSVSEPWRSIASRLLFWVMPAAVHLYLSERNRLTEQLGLRLPPRGYRIRALVMTLVLAVLLVSGTAKQTQRSFSDILHFVFLNAEPRLIAPLFEEFIFRGVFLGELLRFVESGGGGALGIRRRYWAAQFGVAVFFALIHWPYWISSYGLPFALARSLPVFVTGLVLGITFSQSKSLWPAVLIHYLNNELSRL